MLLANMSEDLRVAVVGASGGIGAALVNALAISPRTACVYALSRSSAEEKVNASSKVQFVQADFTKPETLTAAAEQLKAQGKLDLVIVATGLLHGNGISPEKSLRALSADALTASYLVNAVGPALCAQAFLPLLHRDRKTVFAALSARVGSISDNRLGGWHAYRASKAALNMLLKTMAIEQARRFPQSIVVGLHPGTVDTTLSKPFQRGVPDGKLFTAEFSAQCLLNVIQDLTTADSGNLFAWDGQQIPF